MIFGELEIVSARSETLERFVSLTVRKTFRYVSFICGYWFNV